MKKSALLLSLSLSLICAGALLAKPSGKAEREYSSTSIGAPGADAQADDREGEGRGAAASAAEIDALRQNVTRLNGTKKRGDLALALYQLGKALAEQRTFAEAQTNLQAALDIDLELQQSDSIVNDYVAIAMVHTYQKNWDKSKESYEKALAIAKDKQMAHWIVTINNSLGSNAIYAGQYDVARTYFDQAKGAAKLANDFVGEANARLNLAILAQHEGKLKEAIAETEEAGKLLDGDSKDSLLAAQTALNLGQLKDRAGDLDGAIKQYQLAAESGADFQIEASAWVSLGNIKLSRGKAKEAEADFNKALAIYKAENIKEQLPLVLTRLGCAKADLGEFAEAQKLHAQVVQMAKETRDSDDLYLGQYELANDFYLEGNTERSLAKFEELRKNMSSGLTVSDPGALPDVYNGMGRCYKAMGQNVVARDYYTRAMEMYNQAGNKLAAANCRNSIDCIYLFDSSASEYRARYDQMMQELVGIPAKDRETRDYKLLCANVAFNYAQSQVNSAKYDGALESYKSALASFNECGDIRGQMNALVGMGLTRFSAGRDSKDNALLTEAVGYFDQARKIAQQLGSDEGQWDAAIGAGSCYRTLGNAAEAEKNLRLAIQLFEKQKGHLSRDDSKTFTLDFRRSAFDELVALLFEEKRYDDALAVAERGRARAFLDLLEGRQRNVFGDGKLAVLTGGPAGPNIGGGSKPSQATPQARPDNIAAAPAPAKQGPKPRDTSTQVALVAMADIGMATRGVSVVPRREVDLETALSPINADAPTLEQIKALVASHNTCAVEYFVGPDKLYIFVAHPDGKTEGASYPISRKDLYAMVDKTYTSVITPPANLTDLKGSNDRREKNLADLYSVLLAPVKDMLPKDPEALVTIVPHRSLFLVPFAALIDGNKKFLIENHTLSVVPAIGVLRATEKMAGEQATSAGASQDKLLAFGNPTIKFVPGLGALPYAEQEVKKISSLFGGSDRTMIKTGTAATKSALTALAPGYNVIHLATHGLIDEEHPMDSAVLLATEGADDGILSVRDILKLPPLKAHLVTLSACQTGRGKISGDGVAGLSRSFIIAGTPSVMVSLWNVDDVMTAYQMESFYKDYLASSSKATALRQAQLKTITFMEKGLTQAGSRANPRYWAAFQLVGEAK
ncbi:MAG: CHAT domain-containing protein [Cyanobacteria bacterium SZAS TMP-1]|nr:CHAT domain-containing protein [Cyanobacteria bacterium SZAS TMP-1]